LQINRDRSLTNVALTITHLLEKNLVTTLDAEKILWALLGSVYLYEVEEGKRSKYEIMDMIDEQRELLLKEFSRMEDVGDG
jgi:predicted transcriptional regulator